MPSASLAPWRTREAVDRGKHQFAELLDILLLHVVRVAALAELARRVCPRERRGDHVVEGGDGARPERAEKRGDRAGGQPRATRHPAGVERARVVGGRPGDRIIGREAHLKRLDVGGEQVQPHAPQRRQHARRGEVGEREFAEAPHGKQELVRLGELHLGYGQVGAPAK
eukprot:scaffold17198_cov119-Isochrysis_galbana.AAC.7